MSTKRSHTPGPWSLPHFVTADDPLAKAGEAAEKAAGFPVSSTPCRCGYVLSESYCGAIATVHFNDKPGQTIEEGSGDDPPLEEAKANARLIAAAPDMYDSLTAIAKAIEDGTADWIAVARTARAAIAKATGGAS